METNAPNFASHRAGLMGVGLTSALKVSQPGSFGVLTHSLGATEESVADHDGQGTGCPSIIR